jgi:hypothetical protein
MKNGLICALVLLLATMAVSAQDTSTDILYEPFFDLVTSYSRNSAVISGLFTTEGEVRGAASAGTFPSFRAGASIGTIFYRSPMKFIKSFSFFGSNWETIQQTGPSELLAPLVWFDDNFLPIPVTNYHFHIGLPKGLEVGTKFTVAPYGDFIKSVATSIPGSDSFSSYLPTMMVWGLGADVRYTIMKEHRAFPTISLGLGVTYSDTSIGFNNLGLGTVELDETDDAIPISMNFNNRNNNTSISLEFSISKRLKFFQPFFTMRLVQTVTHSITSITVNLDLTGATSQNQATFLSTKNISTDSDGDGIGIVIPVTDFILTGGFEFVMAVFRMGLQGSFSVASQTGALMLSMRFQVEDWQFAKLKKTK